MADHAASTQGGTAHGDESSHHIVPTFIYYRVFTALMVLLVITLVAAAFDLGTWNVVIAMTIAIAKAVLIVLYFMHIRYSSRLAQFFAVAAIFWLAIMFVMTYSDYVSRGWLGNPLH